MSRKISIKVSVAVIFNANKQVLITRRSFKSDHAGCWEFPGGKVEQGEDPRQTVIREVKEEVGLIVKNFNLTDEIHHSYKHQTVHLFVYKIIHFEGKPQCLENQLELRWVAVNQLNEFDFPEANRKIIEFISNLILPSGGSAKHRSN